MFILDSSGSIAPADYETMKGFVVNVIRSLNATEESKIGVINFSSSPQLVVPLTSARDLSSLVNQVRAIEYIGGGTRTDTALDLMEENFRLTPDNGAIPIGILLTDGQSNSPSLTLEAAARVHAADISMYTFGIGDTNPEELRAIASTPYSDYSFYISTFSAADFEQRVFSLTRQACSSELHNKFMYVRTYRYVCNDVCHISCVKIFSQKAPMISLQFHSLAVC